jgi:hypothetical protein
VGPNLRALELSSWWTMRGGTFWWVQKLDLDLVQVPGTRDAPLELKTFVTYDCGVDVSFTLCCLSILEASMYGSLLLAVRLQY